MWWALNKSYIQSHVYCQCTFNLQIDVKQFRGTLYWCERISCCAAEVVWPLWPEDSSRVGFFYLMMERWQMRLTLFFYNDLDISKMQYLQYIGQGRTDNFFSPRVPECRGYVTTKQTLIAITYYQISHDSAAEIH